MYTDYTATVAPGNLMRNIAYPMTMYQTENGSTWYNCMFKVYIDYNQNGVFDLPGELVFSGATGESTAPNFPLTGTTTAVPALAPLGLTRMRCVLDESDVANPTGTYSWGETEDYMVNVIEYVSAPPLATTPLSPADGATGVLTTATLNWAPAVGLVDGYKLHFYNVDLSLDITKDELGPTETTFTPDTPFTYGERIWWKVVPFNLGQGDAVSCPTWSFTVANDPTIVSFPNTQTFESLTFPPYGWSTSLQSGTSTYRWTRNTTYNHTIGGAGAAYLYYYASTGAQVLLGTPAINFPSDSYRVRFWMYRYTGSSYPTQNLTVYYNTANNMTGATLLGTVNVCVGSDPIEAAGTAGWYQYTFNMPAGATGTGRYLFFNGAEISSYSYDSYYVDDVNIEAIPTAPLPAVLVSPTPSGTTGVLKTATLNWLPDGAGLPPTGYKVYFGTAATPVDLVQNDATTTYTPAAPMTYGATYYWKVVPHDASLVDVTGCPIWSFTVESNPAITSFPYTQNFESAIVPELPSGWTMEDVNGDGYYWKTVAAGGNLGPKALEIGYNSAEAMNDWVYTPSVTMVGGDIYSVSFAYKVQSATWPENLEIAVGSAAASGSMGTPLWSQTGLSNTTYTTQTVSFTPSTSGEYYFGWHGFSAADMYNIYIDDVVISHPVDPVIVTDKNTITLPATQIGGTPSTDTFTISNAGFGTLTGTIAYSAGLNGPNKTGSPFSVTASTPLPIEVTYTPTVQGFFAGTVTITSNGGVDKTIDIIANAGKTVATFDAPLPGWSVYDVDGDAISWALWSNTDFAGAVHTGTYAAGCSYNTSNDDYMITPWYQVVTGDKLTFYTRCSSSVYSPEALQVIASTTGNTPTDFTATPLLDLAISSLTYTGYSVDLSSLNGQTVCFAFRQYSDDMDVLFVDDIGLPALRSTVSIPTGIAAAAVPTGVELTWTAVPYTTSYKIYWSADPEALAENWVFLASSATNSYIDTSGAAYRFYKITAVNGSRAIDNEHALAAQKAVRLPRAIAEGKRLKK
jgi:hypothetical protein